VVDTEILEGSLKTLNRTDVGDERMDASTRDALHRSTVGFVDHFLVVPPTTFDLGDDPFVFAVASQALYSRTRAKSNE
jgi:hypothetical protein